MNKHFVNKWAFPPFLKSLQNPLSLVWFACQSYFWLCRPSDSHTFLLLHVGRELGNLLIYVGHLQTYWNSRFFRDEFLHSGTSPRQRLGWGEVAQRATSDHLTLPFSIFFWGGGVGLGFGRCRVRWGLKGPPHVTLAFLVLVLFFFWGGGLLLEGNTILLKFWEGLVFFFPKTPLFKCCFLCFVLFFLCLIFLVYVSFFPS